MPGSVAEAHTTERAESAYDNPRIKALVEDVHRAERALKEALHDLETREQSPSFQKAQALHDAGWRLYQASAYGESALYAIPPGKDYRSLSEEELTDYYGGPGMDEEAGSVGANRALYSQLGLEQDDTEVIRHLLHLTADRGEAS